MVLAGRTPLSGNVEVDEGFLGGANNKKIVMVAAEIRGKATGRVRMCHIHSRTSQEIQKFILDTIEPESTILSDQYKGYVTIVEKGYAHVAQKKPYSWEHASGNDDRLLPHVHHASGNDDRLLPHVHRTIALLKRWYYGTYHGRIDPANLQSYLDEFVFRFNRRTSRSRGLIFHRLLEAAVKAPHKPS